MGDLAWERVADEILGLLIGRFQHGSGHGFCGAGTRIFQEVWVADLAWVLRNIRWLDRNHGIQTRDSHRPLHFAYRQVFCPGAAGARWRWSAELRQRATICATFPAGWNDRHLLCAGSASCTPVAAHSPPT